jgi:hypothetical protein
MTLSSVFFNLIKYISTTAVSTPVPTSATSSERFKIKGLSVFVRQRREKSQQALPQSQYFVFKSNQLNSIEYDTS